MNKMSRFFDPAKSPVENIYYLLMILSIVFIAIQVIIARDSLSHSAQLELTQHTVEQDNRYRVAMETEAEEYVAELQQKLCAITGLDTLSVLLRIDSLIMQQDNLEEMAFEQLNGFLPIPDSLLIANPVEYEHLFQSQIDIATELEQYAFFVLNGFLFEELAYRDLGNTFLRCANLAAVPAIYMQSYAHYNLYQVTVNQHVRQLYDIWWHRQKIEKCGNRIDICRIVLAGDERKMEFLRQGSVAELSLPPDELRSTIRRMEAEIASLEKEIAVMLRRTSVRNM
jgi:hypothetical protein